MALSKNARNKLQKLVQQSKKVLFAEIQDQLQQHYGILANGKVLYIEELTSGDTDVLYRARLLRDRLTYIKSNLADKDNEETESINQLIREQAFTILNRLAALRMAEERGIIRESIHNGYNSEGFQVYDSITGQGRTADVFQRYKWYIFSVFDELALDLPSIFDRFSPLAIIFPGEKTSLELLALINDEGITIHREEGYQPINLWKEDETIGWIYQYYNTRDEIKAMRDASDAPRNSQELAVRNQFFTPRYVVQFLTDNSLGRIWYEMTKGQTQLKAKCPYLIIRPNEVLLNKGEQKPETVDSELVYVQHRAIKDPREIRMLDPACGSMHFGLYSYDLFEIIYLEAWDNYPELLTDLKTRMLRQEFVKQIPELIIRHNIHGVDIDPRALQIAALSLWLRAQKSFDKLNLQPQERPQITKSNLVLAEPMPGNTELLNEVIRPLEAPMRKLVLHIWAKMKMAGETGILLRIEKEIDNHIQEITKQLTEEAKKTQIQIGDSEEIIKNAKDIARYTSKQYREEFLDKAEYQVLEILKHLAEEAHNGNAYQKLLFADDSARGFSFIELSRQNYDVIVMNPPFGIPSVDTLGYLRQNYKISSDNLYIQFLIRCWEILDLNGIIAELSDRSFINKSSYKFFRKEFVIQNKSLRILLDLGENVLDNANVDVAGHIHSRGNEATIFIDARKEKDVKEQLINEIIKTGSFQVSEISYFFDFPNHAFVYSLSKPLLNMFAKGIKVSERYFEAFSGLKSGNAEQTNRLFWEPKPFEIGVDKKWGLFQNGSPYSPYYFGCVMVVLSNRGKFNSILSINSARITGIDEFYNPGVSFGERTDWMYGFKMRAGQIFSINGHAIFPKDKLDVYYTLLIVNSSPFQEVVNSICGQHKGGYINPVKIDLNFFPNYSDKLKLIVQKLEELDTGNETSMVYHAPSSLKENKDSLRLNVKDTVSWRKNIIDEANEFRASYNREVESLIGWEPDYKKAKEYVDYDKILFDYKDSEWLEVNNILSYLFGVVLGRWDILKERKLLNQLIYEDDLAEVPIDQPDFPVNPRYPIKIVDDGILSLSKDSQILLKNKLDDAINFLWKDKASINKDFICETLNLTYTEQYFQKEGLFFDFHLNRYSKNRRQAPIYWPLSTPTGSFTVWIYYHKLNEQTLFKIINNHLKPKQEEVKDKIRLLQNNFNLDRVGQNELHVANLFLDELLEFENELLRITNLPYKPNQDDGVLLTAAPLYKLFRHSKWRKATEDAWKSLNNGEYDWSRVAYGIWSERIKKKCSKNLSLAIAHGLESICEIKPKQAKATKKKMPKEIKKPAQLKIGE